MSLFRNSFWFSIWWIFRVPFTVAAAAIAGWAGVLAVVFGVGVAVHWMGGGGISEEALSMFAWAGGVVGLCVGIAMVAEPIPQRRRRERHEPPTFGFPVERVRDGK